MRPKKMCIECFPPTDRLDVVRPRKKKVDGFSRPVSVQLPLNYKSHTFSFSVHPLGVSVILRHAGRLVVVSCMLQSGHENREMLDQNVFSPKGTRT